jgi:hypothetical protein
LYVTIGCGGILFILLAAVGILAYVGFRAIQTVSEEMTDPVARTLKAEQLLGSEALPEGYYAGPTFSLPWVFDMVILADRMPTEGGDIPSDTDHLFIYFKLIRGGREWSDYVEGKGDPFEMLQDQGFRLQRRESILREELTVGDQQIAFVSERGTFETDDHGEQEGVLTLLFIRCPEDKRLRVAVWTGPDPAPERPVEEVDFTGTHADPEIVHAFMSRFNTCAS